MGIQYMFVNCMVDIKVQQCINHWVKQLQKNSGGGSDYLSQDMPDNAISIRNQKQKEPCIIIDQCDYLQNLPKNLLTILDTNPTTKIILISNQNCTHKIQQIRQPVITVFFMPYTDQQVMRIVGCKLGNLVELVPRRIINQGVKKSGKKSGDFREIQKYLINWAKTQLAQVQIQTISNNVHNFTDPFIQILQKSILTSSRVKNSILLSTLNSIQKLAAQKQKKQLLCKCRSNQIQKIISQHRSQLSKTQCLLLIRQWQQSGVLKLQKSRCYLHNRTIDLGCIKTNISIDPQLIKDMIRRSFYNIV